MTDFFHTLPECCDAWQYVEWGQQCAVSGVCHGPLRPGGAYYWFSIPYRLGISPEILLVFSFLLVLVSMGLAYRILVQLTLVPLLEVDGQRLSSRSWIARGFAGLVVLATHAVFFVPTLFNSLSDPPAAALFLSGGWLLIGLALSKDEKNEIWILLVAGTCWGLSAWLRAFFLYPVLVGLALYVGIRLWSRRYRRGALVFCVALIPIIAQYATIYKTYGTYSYLDTGLSGSVSQMHLTQPFAGYDTLLPHGSYFWSPRTCEAGHGVWNGLKEKKWDDVWCVISNRLYFYLGTYRAVTYIYPGKERLLVEGTSEHIGEDHFNWYTNMQYTPDVELAPSGEKTADRIQVVAEGQLNEIKQWISLEAGQQYTFSVWLWSPMPRTTLLGIVHNSDGNRVVAYQRITLGPKPERFSVTGTVPETTEYNVHIGDISVTGVPVTFGTKVGDYLFAWGAQMEEGAEATSYISGLPVDPDRIRAWHPTLLVINGLVLVLALVFWIVRFRVFWANAAGLAVIMATLVSGAEALAIIPEQRFFVTLLVLGWVMAFALLGSVLVKTLGNPAQRNSEQ